MGPAFCPEVQTGLCNYGIRQAESRLAHLLKRAWGIVASVAFRSDGNRFLSGGADGTLRMWDAHSGEPIGEPLNGHAGSVTSLTLLLGGATSSSGWSDQAFAAVERTQPAANGRPLKGHEGIVMSIAAVVTGLVLSPAARMALCVLSGCGERAAHWHMPI